MRSDLTLAAAALCMLALAGSACGRQPQRAQRGAHGGKQAAAAVAHTRDGGDGLTAVDGPALLERIRKSGRKGTLVNVWASWCGSCKRELPMLAGLRAAFEAEGVAMLFVSADEPAARKAASEFLATLSPRPSGFIVDGALGRFKRALNPAWKGAIPSTFLFDAGGELLYFWPGPVLEHEVATIVNAFLAGQPLAEPTLVEPPGPPG